MKTSLLAGGMGAIGQRLTPRLVEANICLGTKRLAAKAAALEAAGFKPVIFKFLTRPGSGARI